MFQSVHHGIKERGGERISRADLGGLGASLGPPLTPGHQRGVSPTPLGNLKIFRHPDITDTGRRDRVSQTERGHNYGTRLEWSDLNIRLALSA